jgi:hypothetical protein
VIVYIINNIFIIFYIYLIVINIIYIVNSINTILFNIGKKISGKLVASYRTIFLFSF